MIRNIVVFLGLVLAFPAYAFDPDNMTDAERAAFGAAVREYLLENPEVIFEAVDIYEQRQAAAQAQGDAAMISANADAIFDDGYSWVGGNPDGDVTVVEFLDYRCSYCRRAHPEVAELVASDGNIRLIVKEFPILGDESVLASRFAIAVRNVAGDEAYKATHDRLMTLRAGVSSESLAPIAHDLGLDMAEIEAEMLSETVNAELRANYALGQKLGISGTPSFVFGDEMLRGYSPLDGMRQIVARKRG